MFDWGRIQQLPSINHTGPVGIGHVRYPTAGSASAQEAQPFFVNSPLGIYLIHNGNLTNTTQLRDMLQSSHSFFNRHMRTTSDSEVLLNVLADEVHRAHQNCLNVGGDPNSKKAELVFQVGCCCYLVAVVVQVLGCVRWGNNNVAFQHVGACTCLVHAKHTSPQHTQAGEATMKMLRGSYSCISLIMGVGLVAFRDPNGIRPLVLGRRETEKVCLCMSYTWWMCTCMLYITKGTIIILLLLLIHLIIG